MPVTDSEYLQIAVDLQDFMDNNKIEEFRRRTSEHYKDILGRVSTEIGALMKRRSDVDGVILDINRDFVEKNFAGVIKSIELRANESSDKLMQLLMSIHDYTVEYALSIGELNLFSSDNRDEVNRKVVDYLKSCRISCRTNLTVLRCRWVMLSVCNSVSKRMITTPTG